MQKLICGSVLLILLLLPLRTTGNEASPAPTPTPPPTASPKPHRIAMGPQFITLGIATAARSTSEFSPSRTAATALTAWQSGELSIGRTLRLLSTTDVRRYAIDHPTTQPVATIGGGSTRVPAFTAKEAEIESGFGIGIGPHVYATLATLNRTGNYGYPPIDGIGFGLALTPDPTRAVAAYGWAYRYANASGSYALDAMARAALSYRGMRYRVGALVRSGTSRLALDVGVSGESLGVRTNAPSRITRAAVALGLNYRY